MGGWVRYKERPFLADFFFFFNSKVGQHLKVLNSNGFKERLMYINNGL
jgi:hypothetical protein